MPLFNKGRNKEFEESNADKCEDVQPRKTSDRQSWWFSVDEFYEIADEAYDNLPKHFRKNLDNVFIQVNEEAPQEHLQRIPRGHELLGLYVGTPLNKRGTSYGMMNMPDTIYLFSNPIQRVSWGKEQAKEQIRKTLWHEIGHYYGMSDAEMHALGY